MSAITCVTAPLLAKAVPLAFRQLARPGLIVPGGRLRPSWARPSRRWRRRRPTRQPLELPYFVFGPAASLGPEDFGGGSVRADAGRDRGEDADGEERCGNHGEHREDRWVGLRGVLAGGEVEHDPGRDADDGGDQPREQLCTGQTAGDLVGGGAE